MKFLNFYKKKISSLVKIKFITFKLHPVQRYFNCLLFQFKTSSGLSIGSTLLYFLFITRFSLNVKKLFLKLNSKQNINGFPVIDYYVPPSFNKKFDFLKFFSFVNHERTVTIKKKFKILSYGSELVYKGVQQTFLGFSSHMFGGVRFSETYYSFLWKFSFSVLPWYNKYFKKFSKQYDSRLSSFVSLFVLKQKQRAKLNFISSLFTGLLKF